MTESLSFIKMHGIGNDFVVVGPEDAGRELDWPRLARQTGDRHFGIGHDGLLLVERVHPASSAADFRMRMFNPDGSESEMCGNGIRCFAKYLYDAGLTRDRHIRVATGGGIQQVYLLAGGAEVQAVEVDMGVPVFEPSRIPVLSPLEYVERQPLLVADQHLAISAVSMGNPHAVTFVDDVERFPLTNVGPLVEQHPWFPRRVNFEVASVQSRGELTMRVWERGAGITLACGSGACAVMAVARRQGMVDDTVLVHLPGGDLTLHWDGTTGVHMTGPATYVFRGEWPLH